MAIDSFILKEHEHKMQNKAMNVNLRHLCATEYFIARKWIYDTNEEACTAVSVQYSIYIRQTKVYYLSATEFLEKFIYTEQAVYSVF